MFTLLTVFSPQEEELATPVVTVYISSVLVYSLELILILISALSMIIPFHSKTLMPVFIVFLQC